MVIDITNVCRMNCRHCMNRCTSVGRHMTIETFEKSYKFIEKIRPKCLIIGGGEPTEHPNVIEFIKKLKNICSKLVIASNGMFLKNEELKNQIIGELNYSTVLQITNDPRYYPIKVKDPKLKYCYYITELNTMTCIGRAKDNNIPPYKNIVPKCFNLRIGVLQLGDIKKAIDYLAKGGKFCAPSIDMDGNIRFGESMECEIMGTVEDSLETLTEAILKRPVGCDACEMVTNTNFKEAVQHVKKI